MSDVQPCISEDLWFEILTNLPVKTLGKCRCVCKSWDSLIVSPSFMAAHLKRYTQNEANSLLFYRRTVFQTLQLFNEQYVLFRDSTNVNGGISIFAEAYNSSASPFIIKAGMGFSSNFVGSIHGLLCISDHAFLTPAKTRIMIWNPLVRKHINLPQSMTANSGLGDHTSVLGFGYHGKNNDHRVVKISYFSKKDGTIKSIPLVEVYSVQERAWKRRMISSDLMVYNSININVSSSHCFLNGVIHWLTRTVTPPVLGKWLLLFNVEEEKFEEMELPPDVLVNIDIYCRSCIFEYQSKLSLSICDYLDEDSSFNTRCRIWVKEDYNVRSSWCKVLDVALDRIRSSYELTYLGSNVKPFWFLRADTRELVLYDPKTGQTEGLGRLFCNPTTMFSAYTESLVLLDQKI